MDESRGRTDLETAARAVEQLREVRAAAVGVRAALDEADRLSAGSLEVWNIGLLAADVRATDAGRAAEFGVRTQARAYAGNLNAAAGELENVKGWLNRGTAAIARTRETLAQAQESGADGIRAQLDRVEEALEPVRPAVEEIQGTRLRTLHDQVRGLLETDGDGYGDRASRLGQEAGAQIAPIHDRLTELRQDLDSALPAADRAEQAADRAPSTSAQALSAAADSVSRVDAGLRYSSRRLEKLFSAESQIAMADTQERLSDRLQSAGNTAGSVMQRLGEAQGWAALAKVQLREVARLADGHNSGRDARVDATVTSAAEAIDAVASPVEAIRQRMEPLQALPADVDRRLETAEQLRTVGIDAYRDLQPHSEAVGRLNNHLQTLATQQNSLADPELTQATYAGSTPRGTGSPARAGSALDSTTAWSRAARGPQHPARDER